MTTIPIVSKVNKPTMLLPHGRQLPINCLQGPWWALNPWSLADDVRLQALAAYLNQAATQQALAGYEQTGAYPQATRDDLQALGLSSFFVNGATSHAPTNCASATIPHLTALNLLCTSASASLGIDVGVNGLGLIPLYLGAATDQLAWLAERVTNGAFCSLLLTEVAHGSNLLANETYAEAGTLTADGYFVPLAQCADDQQPSHYRLNGCKDLINGGRRHELMVLFARTGCTHASDQNPRAAQSDFTLFLLDRRDVGDAITSPHRWHTLPTPAADIASVRFKDVVVPATARLGTEGSGFRLVQKTLGITRGGVSAFAVGLANRAMQLTSHYVQTRRIYDGPLLELGVITDHLLHARALELLIAAMSLKATALLNGCAVGGAHYAHVAKYACCTLAEELVTEGRLVHGAAALLVDHPYHRLIGDVLLFGTFDGTTHLTLEQIQWRLTQIAVQTAAEPGKLVAQMKSVYQTPPQPLGAAVHRRSRTILLDPSAYLHELVAVAMWADITPLVQISRALLALVRQCRDAGLWEADQGLRFTIAKLCAWLETLVALVEWADPGARQVLGLPERPINQDNQALYTFVLGWFGGRLVAELSRMAAGYGLTISAELVEAAQTLGHYHQHGRQVFVEEPQRLIP